MNIKSIKYANSEQNSLVITTQENKQLSAPWPCRTWHNEEIQNWIEKGNSIEEIAAPTIDELREAKKAEINTAFEKALNDGVEYIFPDSQKDVIQTRPVDQTNLTALALSATQMIQTGDNTLLPFRAKSNITYQMWPQDMIALTNHALAFVSSLYQTAWELKDKISKANRQTLNTITWE